MGDISVRTVELFAQAYVAGGARAAAMHEAAVAAGLSDNPVTKSGWNFLRRKDVQARVAELMAEKYGVLDVTAQRVFEEIASIGFADPAEWMDANGDLIPPHLMSPRARAAIASIDFETRMVGNGQNAIPVSTIKIRTHNKNEMLKLMAQHFKIIDNSKDGINALATELTKQLKEGRERARALRKAGVTDAEDAVIIPVVKALPEPAPEREDYA